MPLRWKTFTLLLLAGCAGGAPDPVAPVDQRSALVVERQKVTLPPAPV